MPIKADKILGKTPQPGKKDSSKAGVSGGDSGGKGPAMSPGLKGGTMQLGNEAHSVSKTFTEGDPAPKKSVGKVVGDAIIEKPIKI